MTPEQWEKEVAWTRRMVELEDRYGGADLPAGRVLFLAKKFPIPDTTGLSAEQAEAVLAKWRAEVKAFTDAADRAPFASPVTPPISAPIAPPEVPAS